MKHAPIMRLWFPLGIFWLVGLTACSPPPPAEEDNADLLAGNPARAGVLPSTIRAYELLDKSAEQTYENPLKTADSLRAEYKLSEALRIYNKVLAQDPKNYETLWKKSCTISEIGFLLTNPGLKEGYYTEALHLAKQALGIEPEGVGANFAMALALARMESVVDDHRKVTFAIKMKRHAEKVLRLDPTYHYAWYLLGSWSYDFAGLSASDYNVAKALFGTNEVDNATYQHAVEYFNTALKYDPKNVIYNYHAAMAHIQVGEEDQAMECLRVAVNEPIDAEKEEEFIRKFNLMITGQATTR